jgi:hypothetical protein
VAAGPGPQRWRGVDGEGQRVGSLLVVNPSADEIGPCRRGRITRSQVDDQDLRAVCGQGGLADERVGVDRLLVAGGVAQPGWCSAGQPQSVNLATFEPLRVTNAGSVPS